MIKFKVRVFDTPMKLFLPAYSQGHHRISEVIEPGEIELNTSLFSRPIEVQVQFDRHDPYLRLHYDTRTWVHQVCDRCLADYDHFLNVEGKLIFVLGGALQHRDTGQDQIQYIPADSQDIDLSADMRDALMLDLPAKSVCCDTCKGLCPRCGQNLNERLCSCLR